MRIFCPAMVACRPCLKTRAAPVHAVGCVAPYAQTGPLDFCPRGVVISGPAELCLAETRAASPLEHGRSHDRPQRATCQGCHTGFAAPKPGGPRCLTWGPSRVNYLMILVTRPAP